MFVTELEGESRKGFTVAALLALDAAAGGGSFRLRAKGFVGSDLVDVCTVVDGNVAWVMVWVGPSSWVGAAAWTGAGAGARGGRGVEVDLAVAAVGRVVLSAAADAAAAVVFIAFNF